MAAVADYLTTIKIGGTTTAVTAAATTNTSGNIYQITTAARRVIDPGVAVTVKDGGVAITSGVTIDPLFGIITLASPAGGAVTVDYSYIPLLTLASCREYKFSMSRQGLDSTNHDTGLYHTRIPGLVDMSGSLSTFEIQSYDHDPGAGTAVLLTLINSGTPVLLERTPSGGSILRAWVLLSSLENGGAVADLNDLAVAFELAARTITGRTDVAGVSLGS